MGAIANLDLEQTPSVIRQKLDLEKEALEQYSNRDITVLPHSTEQDYIELIEDLRPFMEKLV